MTEFEAIYQEYFRDVFLYVQGLSGDAHIAEEVTQETFFRAMKAVRNFRGDCDIRVWLCQIAKNEYYGYLRKNKKLMPMDFAEAREAGTDADGHAGRSMGSASTVENVTAMSDGRAKDMEQRLIDTETTVKIHKLLHNMPEPYKEVFQLRVFGELSFEQIGDIFGKTPNWACVTYHRAKSKIQKEMEEWQ